MWCSYYDISISIKLLPSCQWCWSHCRPCHTVRGVAGMFRVARLEECSGRCNICQKSDIGNNKKMQSVGTQIFLVWKHGVLLFLVMQILIKSYIDYVAGMIRVARLEECERRCNIWKNSDKRKIFFVWKAESFPVSNHMINYAREEDKKKLLF